MPATSSSATSFVPGARFSHDDRWLVAATWSGAAVAWDTTTWRRAAVLEPAFADVNGVVNARVRSDRSLPRRQPRRARASTCSTPPRCAPVRSIPIGVQGLPYHATFDRTGRRLLVVLDTDGVLTYDVETGRRLGAALPGDVGADVAFLDADTLAIPIAARGQILVWHLDADRLETEACRAAGRNLTREEWAAPRTGRRAVPADVPAVRRAPGRPDPVGRTASRHHRGPDRLTFNSR